MLECNYLSILLKPNFEKPIDTAEDIIDRGLAILSFPGQWSKVDTAKKSPFYETRTLAERTIIPKVIFCFIEIFNFLHFNFPDRIGMSLMKSFEMCSRLDLL